MALPIRHGGGSSELHRAWDPFSEFEDMWSRMGRLLEQAAAPASTGGVWMPTAEEEEEENAYVVRAELPGVPAESIDIEVEGDELSITGELTEERRGKVLSRRTGRFSYRTSMPTETDSDRIAADLTDGVLTVRIPKRRAGHEKRRRIEIGGRQGTIGDAARAGGPAQPAQTAEQPGGTPPPTRLPSREGFGTDEMGGIPE
ncbi:Hsp20/alpha crystallin family protein [Streptomyces sp. NPDC049597]|uniref:Hsp20/alpha crystallin family protein n=1 Tax=Streptomyces sp. NPDC049597 TaxID=3155276 RepID=UPI00341A2770